MPPTETTRNARANCLPHTPSSRVILRNLQHYGPITALKICSNYVLCGCGSFLKVFELNEDFSYRIIYDDIGLKRNNIHGICLSPDCQFVILSGGKSFIILNFGDIVSGRPTYSREKAINEWIASVHFLRVDEILILTSHNVVYRVSFQVIDEEQYLDVFDSVHCNEKSLLYTGSIQTTQSHTYIAAGTVMDGIYLWDLGSRKILRHLTDHEGSIFSVKVDHDAKYVASCSDDRSIKLYDMQTGKLLATGWGHASRIWNLEFFKDEPLKILSAGEDCTARVWEYNSASESLKMLEVWDCHLGKHIWSSDVEDQQLQICVTGGADGNVRLHDVSNLNANEIKYSLLNISSDTKVIFSKKEVIKQFVELPLLGIVVALTNLGKLLRLEHSLGRWDLVDIPDEEMERFNNFGLMECFPEINTVAMSTRNGSLLLLEFDNSLQPCDKLWVEEESFSNGVVSNIFVLSREGRNEFLLLIDSPNPKVSSVLKIFGYQGAICFLGSIKLQKPFNSVFTATSALISPGNYLVLGSRFVSVCVYYLDMNLSELPVLAYEKKLSQEDTVSSISLVEEQDRFLTLLLVVRDGIYLIMRGEKKNSGISFKIIHKNKISKGFWKGVFLRGVV